MVAMPLQYGKKATLFSEGGMVASARPGGMAERLKAAVLKTAKGESPS
jgi:hypothetical protein